MTPVFIQENYSPNIKHFVIMRNAKFTKPYRIMDITERQIMGILDTEKLNSTDTVELNRTRRLEARRARERAFSDAVAALCPSVLVALREFPSVCAAMECEYVSILMRKKPTLLNRKGYEKLTGIPVSFPGLTDSARSIDGNTRFFEDYLVFIANGKYYVAKDKDYRWRYGAGCSVHFNRYGIPRLLVYPDELPELAEASLDEAAGIAAERMVRVYGMYALADRAAERGQGGRINAAFTNSFSKEIAGLLRRSYTAFISQDYEKAITLFFTASIKQMEMKKSEWLYKLIEKY